MQLNSTCQTILGQINELTLQLSDAQYSARLELLSGNTIGKHVRHIIEFMDLLVCGCEAGIINYDRRKHDEQLEESTKASLLKIEKLKSRVNLLSLDEGIFLEVSYTQSDEDKVTIKSSIGRELAYNIEHAIHHMAIIRIAVRTAFPHVRLSEHFGVAYSTVRYQNLMRN